MLTELSDIIASVFVNGSITALARVVDWQNDLLLQETTSSIHYTVYDSNGDAISGHTNVSLDKTVVLFDTLQTSPAGIWTADTTGFNFMHTVDVADLGAAFASAGQYELVYTITPSNGQNIIVRYAITAF